MAKHELMHLSEPKSDNDAVTQKYLDQYLKHDGSSQMTGVQDMGGYSVTNFAEPVSMRDIVTKAYADNIVGPNYLDLQGNKIMNLRERTARSDGVTKGYVDRGLDSIFNVDLNM